MYGLPNLESIYLVKIELEVGHLHCPEKKNKEEKSDLEEKIYTLYLGLLIVLSPFLNLELVLSRAPSQ